MAEGITLKRIIDMDEAAELTSSDYALVDSATGGPKKFALGNELSSLKEDLNSNGITDDLRDALLQLAAHVAYIDDDGQDYYDDLEDALMTNKWKITNTLSNCVSSNSSKFVDKGSSYSATISASTGYTLTGATVSVTMGGTDITSTAYNNGSITIASVNGNIVITVTAAAISVSSISAVYTQSGTVYDTDSLDSLKPDLVVTATYSDTSTATVASTDYTLSGTLTAGTSTVTVTYEGKTATFNVTVTANRSSIFGTFVNGHAVSKITSGTTIPVGGIYISSASARAAFSTPIVNNNYVFTVTDTTKYNIAVYDVVDNTPISTSYSAAIEHVYYTGGSKSISWKTTDSAETSYIIVSLKKLDNTAFNDSELANGAEAVFTFTTT